MSHLENDMDEMFYKAGQDYPLNTDKKDWDAVASGLRLGETPAAVRKGNRYYRFLPLLLLLVPVVFLMFNNQVSKPTTGSEKAVVDRPSQKNATMGGVRQKLSTAFSKEIAPSPNQQHVSSSVTPPGVRSQDKKQSTIRVSASQHILPGLHEPSATSSIIQPSLNKTRNDIQTTLKWLLLSPSFEIAGKPSSDISIDERSFFLMPQPSEISSVSKKKQNKTSGFYYGVKIGPDISTVKNQRVDKLGYNAGILLGYQLNDHWSLEVSGLWSSKKYYTDGKHFDKKNARIPASVNIYYLEGGCNMIEIPIAVRYSFSNAGSGFFATAGVNSYLMNKEEYSYMADAGTGVYEGYRTYKKSGNHLFSNLQVSGGYQFNVFDKTSIRIEPYLQLPVRNVGIGKMPITSAGVHFGLMRRVN